MIPGGHSGTPTPVRAAGGVIGRRRRGAAAEVVLVHRPRFDDWSLPKGKLKRGEHPTIAAVREVGEETGIRPIVGARLPTVRYEVWSGDELAEKVVDYWAMTAGGAITAVPGEVDDMAWLTLEQAIDRASYLNDKRVLRAYAELPEVYPPVLVVRHASAGERARWAGPDRERPLDAAGQAAAAALARVLACFAPVSLISARALRCRETLMPLATTLGLTVTDDRDFDEDAPPDIAADRIRALADPAGAVVVCTQRTMVSEAMRRLTGRTVEAYHSGKGEGWALSFHNGRLVTADALTFDATAALGR